MNSPISILRFVLLALAGMLLAAYGFSYQISIHPGADSFRRLLDSTPKLKALLSFPPGIFVAISGMTILIIAVHRLRAAWLLYRIATRRRMVPGPAVTGHAERNARHYPGAAHDPADADWENEEYGPGPSAGPSHYDPYRGNGRYDPRQVETYR